MNLNQGKRIICVGYDIINQCDEPEIVLWVIEKNQLYIDLLNSFVTF